MNRTKQLTKDAQEVQKHKDIVEFTPITERYVPVNIAGEFWVLDTELSQVARRISDLRATKIACDMLNGEVVGRKVMKDWKPYYKTKSETEETSQLQDICAKYLTDNPTVGVQSLQYFIAGYKVRKEQEGLNAKHS